MRAVILAGGEGRRLLPLTADIPKPLVPVGGVPILEILIRQLQRQGFDRLTIAIGYRGDQIRRFCGSGDRWGVAVDYLTEDAPLGTVGCLGLLDADGGDRVLVVNGDTLTDLDMAEVFLGHDPADALTLSAHPGAVRVDFGVLESQDGYLTRYVEKPELTYRVSMGVNVVSTWAVQRFVARGQRLDLPGLVDKILSEGGRVRVRETTAFWLDLGRVGDLEAGQAAFAANPQRFLPG